MYKPTYRDLILKVTRLNSINSFRPFRELDEFHNLDMLVCAGKNDFVTKST